MLLACNIFVSEIYLSGFARRVMLASEWVQKYSFLCSVCGMLSEGSVLTLLWRSNRIHPWSHLVLDFCLLGVLKSWLNLSTGNWSVSVFYFFWYNLGRLYISDDLSVSTSLSPLLMYQFSSVHSVMSNSLWPHGLQHSRPPCPSPTPRVYSNSCPLSQWCHPTISSSVVPLSSHLQSFPGSGSFQMSQLFTSGDQSIGVSPSASVLPMNIQDWFPLG